MNKWEVEAVGILFQEDKQWRRGNILSWLQVLTWSQKKGIFSF